MVSKSLGFIGALLLTFSLFIQPAGADYQSHTETAWRGDSVCLKTQAEINSSDVQGPYWAIRATAQNGSDVDTSGCTPGGTAPAGSLAIRMSLYRWDGSQWYDCYDYNWSYSYQDAWAWQISDLGGNTYCGPGYYGIYAFGGRFDQGNWYGWDHAVWSGYELFNGSGGTYNLPTRLPTLPPISIPFTKSIKVP